MNKDFFFFHSAVGQNCHILFVLTEAWMLCCRLEKVSIPHFMDFSSETESHSILSNFVESTLFFKILYAQSLYCNWKVWGLWRPKGLLKFGFQISTLYVFIYNFYCLITSLRLFLICTLGTLYAFIYIPSYKGVSGTVRIWNTILKTFLSS